MNKFDAVIEHFGGCANLAKKLGVSPPAVSQWRYVLPKGRAYQIEVLTEGKFKANDLTSKRGQDNG